MRTKPAGRALRKRGKRNASAAELRARKRARAATRAASTQAIPRTVNTAAAAALESSKPPEELLEASQPPEEILEATKLATEVVQNVAMSDHDLNQPQNGPEQSAADITTNQEWICIYCTVTNAIKYSLCPNCKCGRPGDIWTEIVDESSTEGDATGQESTVDDVTGQTSTVDDVTSQTSTVDDVTDQASTVDDGTSTVDDATGQISTVTDGTSTVGGQVGTVSDATSTVCDTAGHLSTVSDRNSTVDDGNFNIVNRVNSTVPDQPSTVPEKMYYPISGKYYTGEDVIVGDKYATTVEAWQVAFINDRRETPMGVEYQVLWVHHDRSCKRLYMRSWEPRSKLEEDDFETEMALVDRWKASSVPLFETFWKEDEEGYWLIGADEDNLCVFQALKRAAKLLGRPDLVTEQDIEQFIDDRLVLYKQDLRAGATWIDVRDFMIRLREAGRDINYNAFVKNNYMKPGRRGARVMMEEPLKDGVYIVAAYNHSHIGHAAVLSVQGRKRLIYDKKNEKGKPITSAKGWINFYAFIRPFIIFK